MRIRIVIGAAGGLLLAAGLASAQPPPGGGDGPPPSRGGDLVTRMMTFDKDKDGTLTRAEITDERLVRLFDRADADKDGVVTRGELNALQARERGNARGGFGGPGRGGPMMGGPPPRPGEVLSPGLQDRLNLSESQKAQVDDLQRDVDARLAKILNDDQKARLREIRQRGPGRPGGGGPPPPPPDDDR